MRLVKMQKEKTKIDQEKEMYSFILDFFSQYANLVMSS